MEVILLEKIRNLGKIGDKVQVRPGYGRNYLIPYGKALPATAKNISEFEAMRAGFETRAKESLDAANARAEKLANLAIQVAARASEEGKLFGSIGTREIAQAITNAGVEIHKNEILMPEGPLRYIGEYQIELQLHTDVVSSVKVLVVTEQ